MSRKNINIFDSEVLSLFNKCKSKVIFDNPEKTKINDEQVLKNICEAYLND